MVVETAHDKDAYWIAVVDGVFGQLLSLRWEGTSEQVFQDIRKNPCYPLGYFTEHTDHQLAPPAAIKSQLTDEAIKNVADTYAHKKDEQGFPLEFYSRGGISADLFEVGCLLEIAHKLNPEKHWLVIACTSFDPICNGVVV